jgi:hypothetical protein
LYDPAAGNDRTRRGHGHHTNRSRSHRLLLSPLRNLRRRGQRERGMGNLPMLPLDGHDNPRPRRRMTGVDKCDKIAPPVQRPGSSDKKPRPRAIAPPAAASSKAKTRASYAVTRASFVATRANFVVARVSFVVTRKSYAAARKSFAITRASYAVARKSFAAARARYPAAHMSCAVTLMSFPAARASFSIAAPTTPPACRTPRRRSRRR